MAQEQLPFLRLWLVKLGIAFLLPALAKTLQ
jgi:hypothetical protein